MNITAAGGWCAPPQPRCWCGEAGVEIVSGEWLCQAGHIYEEPEPQRMVREFAEVGIPIYLDPDLVLGGGR